VVELKSAVLVTVAVAVRRLTEVVRTVWREIWVVNSEDVLKMTDVIVVVSFIVEVRVSTALRVAV
jgi:hypothetical protein